MTTNDLGRVPKTAPGSREPSREGVSAASGFDPSRIPGPQAWRTDSPPFGKRPIWQYVWLQGSKWHSDAYWFRQGWGTAGIRTNDAADSLLGYRASDIERICRDNDIDIETVRLVGWLPAFVPALLAPVERPALKPCEDGEWAQSASDSDRSGEAIDPATKIDGSTEGESAGPQDIAQKGAP